MDRRTFHKSLLSVALASLGQGALGAKSPVDQDALTVLNRLTYGATPDTLKTFKTLGLEEWLTQELNRPLEDPAFQERLNNATMLIEYEDGETGEGAPWTALSEVRGYTSLYTDPKDLLVFLDFTKGISWEERTRATNEVISASLMRAVHGQNQLREVMTQFWHEHFSVNALKDEATAIYFPQYDQMMRKNALGNFRELLGETARAPVMLTYLNNEASQASPANENYARELLELHTLGAEHYFNDLYDDWKKVPGATTGNATGYIDQDVYEVARAFTGWTIGDGRYLAEESYAPETGRFHYVESWHDPYQKRILGHEFRPNSAKMEDGERVLDLLAAHPGTARFVTRKMLRRLGIERPSADYHKKIIATFLDTRDAPDQIAQVVRAIVLHPEFLATPPQKLKRPFEYLASLYRTTGAELNSPRYSVYWWLERAGWTQHRVRPPTGHSDASESWSNTRALNGMVDLAVYAHDDWFDVADIEIETAHDRSITWGKWAEAWSLRFGSDTAASLAALEMIGADPNGPLTDDPGYLGFGNYTAIALNALSKEFLFR